MQAPSYCSIHNLLGCSTDHGCSVRCHKICSKWTRGFEVLIGCWSFWGLESLRALRIRYSQIKLRWPKCEVKQFLLKQATHKTEAEEKGRDKQEHDDNKRRIKDLTLKNHKHNMWSVSILNFSCQWRDYVLQQESCITSHWATSFPPVVLTMCTSQDLLTQLLSRTKSKSKPCSWTALEQRKRGNLMK
jgi:hypothetical protein